VKQIEKGISTKENRHLTRVMRSLFSTRKRLNDFLLKRLINYFYSATNYQQDRDFLLGFVDVNATSSAVVAVIFFYLYSKISNLNNSKSFFFKLANGNR
jgi:hypothetical protein